MNAEIRTAKNLYFWLWLSPLLTIPTLVLVILAVFKTYTSTCEAFNNLSSSAPPTLTQVNALAIDPLAPATLYAGTFSNKALKSTDGGESWQAAGDGLSVSVHTLAIDPQTTTTLYAGSGDNLYKTTDGGAKWSRSDGGMIEAPANGLPVWDLAIDPQMPTTIYAGTSNGVFKSTDGAKSWRAVESGMTGGSGRVYSLAIDPLQPATLYASTETGMYQSTDGGETWKWITPAGTDKKAHHLAIASLSPTTLYAMTRNEIFKSTDGGESWKPADAGLSGDEFTDLAIDPLAPTTLYAATWGYGVFKSTNSGQTWNPANTGLFLPRVSCLAIDPQTPATLYAGTEGSVFKSTDGGENWMQTGDSVVETGAGEQADCAPPHTAQMITGFFAILVSALWHLVLVIPILFAKNKFVRWHAGQALLLAFISTVALIMYLGSRVSKEIRIEDMLWVVPILVAIWFGSTLWGQRQAARGDCALMRWAGRTAELPRFAGNEAVSTAPDNDLIERR